MLKAAKLGSESKQLQTHTSTKKKRKKVQKRFYQVIYSVLLLIHKISSTKRRLFDITSLTLVKPTTLVQSKCLSPDLDINMSAFLQWTQRAGSSPPFHRTLLHTNNLPANLPAVISPLD